jgi:hypothetical protein
MSPDALFSITAGTVAGDLTGLLMVSFTPLPCRIPPGATPHQRGVGARRRHPGLTGVLTGHATTQKPGLPIAVPLSLKPLN